MSEPIKLAVGSGGNDPRAGAQEGEGEAASVSKLSRGADRRNSSVRSL
jgi:hypothetical protein